MINKTQENTLHQLPAGFTVRPATLQDIDQAMEIFNLSSQEDIGKMNSAAANSFILNGLHRNLTRRQISSWRLRRMAP
ncbi:MAG: hypothetical protein JXA13_08590 [Anaerolineales bacterium]|nr:hypothetical protein [Anaerolineales bacterium]